MEDYQRNNKEGMKLWPSSIFCSRLSSYKNVVDALIRIVREEGVFTLWRGAFPTIGRAMALNAAQLSTYDQAKQVKFSFTGLFVLS